MPPARRICAACQRKRGWGLSGGTWKYCDTAQLSVAACHAPYLRSSARCRRRRTATGPRGAPRSARLCDAVLERLPHRLEVVGQRRQGAEIDMALVGAVEVAAAGGEQAEFARRIGIACGLGG